MIAKLSHQLIEFYDKISSWEDSVVKESGLSPAQMHTIEVIGHRENMRMKELAERLAITTGTLTVSVDKLEQKGFVKRKPHESDRRSWLIVLTDKGKDVFEQHHKFHDEFTAEITAELSSDQVVELSALLGRVIGRM